MQTWLDGLGCDVLTVQEPWRRTPVKILSPRGYRSIGGNINVWCWLRSHSQLRYRLHIEPRWERIDLGSLVVYNVYLPEHSKTARTKVLGDLRCDALKRTEQPIMLVGDFNLAPALEDGRYGDRVSTWTGKAERAALNRLLSEARLTDMTSRKCTGRLEFSIERMLNGVKSAFRCDLALLSESMASVSAARYDHSVRVSPSSFTDHSSIIVDIPIGCSTETRQKKHIRGVPLGGLVSI